MLKYQQLEAQNKPIVIKLKYYKHIILNKELTAIEKIITFPRGLEVEEYIPKNQAWNPGVNFGFRAAVGISGLAFMAAVINIYM